MNESFNFAWLLDIGSHNVQSYAVFAIAIVHYSDPAKQTKVLIWIEEHPQ